MSDDGKMTNLGGWSIPPGVLVFDHITGRVYIERGPWRRYL